MIIHNSIEFVKGNIWLFWHASLSIPTVVLSTKQSITVKVGEVLVTWVHAACLIVDRRSLWEDLKNINELNLPWLVIGDFNVVLSCEEKKGGRQPLKVAMQDFRDCIEYCNLIQAPRTGIKFSWCNNRVGKKRILCDLDRAFYNLQWLECYVTWCYKVGVRGTSDHGALLGGVAQSDKPHNIPFIYQSVWTTHPGFLKEVFGDLRVKVKTTKEVVLKASLESEADPENIVLLNNLVTARGLHELASQQYNELMRSKSRVKWVKEGGANTYFFHASLKIRKAQNNITELETPNGDVVTTQSQIADILVKHYHKKFEQKTVNFEEDLFEAIPNILNEEDNDLLDALPSQEEIKNVVFAMDPNSAPGPDGFPGCFYRYAWEVEGAELMKKIQFCWRNRFIPKARIPVLINGGPCGFFEVGRGLRQGDPLLPIMFVLAEEISSGQEVNKAKSKCFVGGETDPRKQGIAEMLQMELSSFPDKYLGVILKLGRVKNNQVWGIVEMMQKMLAR
ncbi:uncharacterized protein LOC113359498 [Papaver somniferum]|uniref:uncharacterized protein LOC113359498 n=1 Tax=Papaver somniferum TaxID=3469 RepID=UPI000E6FAF10|nr:uncharacterized protein LOC113359498 [Papaver somniferum]